MKTNSQYDSEKGLRDTLLEFDDNEVFQCSGQFQSLSKVPFLDPKILAKLFTYEDITIQQRMSQLKKYGGLIFLLNGLKVWHEIGLTRFSSFTQRQVIYGVNYQSPNSIRKYILKLRTTLKNGGLIRWFLGIWSLAVIIQYIYDELESTLHFGLTLLMLIIFMLSKAMVKNFVDSDINKSLSYSKSATWVTVRREGRIVKIQQSKLLVGDIMLFSADDTVSVDGILVKASESLCVDEYKTISQRFNTPKTTGWDLDQTSDPYIFAGSEIVFGKGQMLVCCVGDECTSRTVTKSSSYLKKKTKYIREGQAKYIILSMKIAQAIIAVVIYFKMLFLLVQESPLSLRDTPIILRNFAQLLSWALILQDMQRIQYMYCFIEKRTYQQKQFKIINKLVLGELLKLDVLLIDEGMLETQEQHIPRQNRHIYLMLNQQILSELNTVVDIKIMTPKPISQCRQQLKLNKPYSINKEIVDLDEIQKFQDSKFICNVDPPYYLSFLVKAFLALNYKVGVVPMSIQDKLESKVIILSTEDSKEEVQKISWVKLNSSTCEQGLKRLYLISTNFYILMSALMNQHFLSLVAVVTCVLFVQLPIWVVLLLVVVQISTIYATFMMINLHESSSIETGQSFESTFVAHHLTIIPFFLYAIYKISNPKDIAIFLICRNIVSVIYNTRMGQLIKLPSRHKIMLTIYSILFLILSINMWATFILGNSTRQPLILIVMVVSMNLIYLAEKNYNDTMRKKPHVSFV